MQKCSSKFWAAVLALMLALCSPVWADVAIDETSFPDEVFRNFVAGYDSNSDGILTASEIAQVTTINVANKEIYSLKGIEYFTVIISLNCSNNRLTELDVSKNTALVILDCSNNEVLDVDTQKYLYGLASLNVSGCSALMELYCDRNKLTVLDVSANTKLTRLECDDNRLTALDVSKNTALEYLGCSENRITALDVSGHTALQDLFCGYNEALTTLNLSGCTSLTEFEPDNLTHLTVLNISGCTSLVELACGELPYLAEVDASGCTALTDLTFGDEDSQGSLASLNLTGCTALQYISCAYNKLTSLNLSTLTKLQELNCAHNALTALDVSNNSALDNLECNHNYLTSLNVGSNTALTGLDCSSNYLTAIDVSRNTALTWLDCSENELTALDVSKNTALKSLYCSSNKLTDLDVSSNTNIEYLYFDNNYLSEVDLSSNTALTNLGTAYNQSSTWDVSEYTALEYLDCDFPITVAANSSYELDFTVFTEKYGIDGEFDYNHGVSIAYHRHSEFVSAFTIAQSSEKHILRFLRLAEGDIELVTFRCKLNDSDRYIYVRVMPSASSSSMTAPLVTTSSLPEATIDKDYGIYNYYDQYLSAYGAMPISWKITDGFLPVGLYMEENGEICGDPIVSGTYSFTVRARNKLGSSTRTFTITIPAIDEGYAPIITTPSLTAGTSGIPYGFQLTAASTSSVTWYAESLPSGLALSSSGYISGTPTESGTFSLKVTAENAYDSDTWTLPLTIAEPPSGAKPSITTESLDAATAGSEYAYQLGVYGTPPFTWTVKGKMPAGLSINSSGLITGTPTKKSSKNFTITVTNSQGSDSKKFTLSVNELPEILTQTLKDATLGKNYKQALKAKGTKPLTWEIDGTLPEGITFDAEKGKFSGTPTGAGTGAVTLTLSNSAGSVSKTYTLTVSGNPPKIGLSKLKDAKYSKNYKANFKVKGTAPITLVLVGELPEGLSFDSNAGTITGTPTEACTDRAIRLIASNAGGVVSRDYTLTVQAIAPKIKTKKLPDAVKGKAYSADIEVTGTAPITWAVEGLPEGLSINTSGEISGTPTESGKFKATITAANSAKTAKKNMKLIVIAAPEFSDNNTLPAGTEGKSYKYTPAVTGTKTITFSVVSGSLPGGISLNAKKGTLKGKPTASGTFTFTMKAANSAGEASIDFTLTIAAKTTTNKSAYAYPDNEGVTRNVSSNHGGNISVIQNETPVNIGSDFDGGYVVVAELPAVSVDVSGMYDFSVVLDEKAHAGEKLLWLANSSEPSDDDSVAEFSDEDGQEIERVPENRRVNVSAWLNAGKTYRPAIAIVR